MINTQIKSYDEISHSHADSSRYTISFGETIAPYTIDIFYGMECGFSREFLQNDFKIILETIVLTKKALIRLHPAALDPMTTLFAELIRTMPLDSKRSVLMQFCRNDSTYQKLLPDKPSENVFFDITKILSDHPEITETLMIKINGIVSQDVPSLYALEHEMKLTAPF